MSDLVALVDARNVLRSRWPNIPEDELVEAARGLPRIGEAGLCPA